MRRRGLPSRCPSCSGSLIVSRLSCPYCGTEVTGEFEPCPVCTLEGAHRELFELFLAARGNLKEVQRALGVSYPTTRLRVEEMFQRLGQRPAPPEPKAVLKRLREGLISVEDAERLLKGETD